MQNKHRDQLTDKLEHARRELERMKKEYANTLKSNSSQGTATRPKRMITLTLVWLSIVAIWLHWTIESVIYLYNLIG